MKYADLVNRYYIKLWMTEYDREHGFADEYYKNFNNLEVAIKDLRTYFYDDNCICVEIYDCNNKLCYVCDKKSEDFYINNVKVRKINQELLNGYIDELSNNKDLSCKDSLVYCEKNKELFVAINNSNDKYYIKSFKDERDVFDWLMKKYEKDEIEL